MRNRVVVIDNEGNPISFWGLVNVAYDYIAASYPTDTQEVYTFKSGGSGGTTVKTVTVDYVDSSKAQLSAVTAT